MNPVQDFGKYKIKKKIAVGGMGEIFLADFQKSEGFEKEVVIKKLLPHLSQNKSYIEMFQNEAKLAANLTHNNIVQIYDYGKMGDIYYLAMEYVHGVSLQSFIACSKKKGIQIPLDTIYFIISGILKGLDYAYNKTDEKGKPYNLVHRDLSPHNILISTEGSVKIIDFGLAKHQSFNVKTGGGEYLKGKLNYLSPEQLHGKPVTHQTDIFAVGLILFELITGQLFLDNIEDLTKLTEKIDNAPKELDNGKYDIPKELKNILKKALSSLPQEKYTKVLQMKQDLDSYFADWQQLNKRTEIKDFLISVYGNIILAPKKGGTIALTKDKNNSKEADFSDEIEISRVFEIDGQEEKIKHLKRLRFLVGIMFAVIIGAILSFFLIKYFETNTQNEESGTASNILQNIPSLLNIETKKENQPALQPVSISTSPSGADILINGVKLDEKTPVKLNKYSIGETIQVTLSHPGFRPEKITYKIKETENSINVTLNKLSASLQLTNKQTLSRWQLSVNEKSMPLSQMIKLTTAQNIIEFRNENLNFSLALEVSINKITNTDFLNNIPFRMSATPWANVILDGKELGATPVVSKDGSNLKEGNHKLEINFPGYEKLLLEFNITL